MIVADFNLSVDPAWPWSLPGVGLPALLGVAVALAALTVWTYAGVRQASWRRVLAILLLRLAALAVPFLALLRPSFGVTQLQGVEASKLLVVFDQSESMTVADMPDSASRWQHLTRLWQARAVRNRLAEMAAIEKIEVVPYLGADELRPNHPDAKADGKRTDIGAWLQALWQKHAHEKHLRGIVLFSDGADNGTRFSAQQEAGRWRGICPIAAFGLGNPNDPKFRKDIGLTSLDVEPNPVSIKSKMRIVAKAQAPGFEKVELDAIASIERVTDKKPALPDAKKTFAIRHEKDQAIVFDVRAPQLPGEYKVTLKIPPQADEADPKNNEISTYVQVIKEKINVLWVDRRRVYEPQMAIRALTTDRRFEVDFVIAPIQLEVLDGKQYDVIVIGDVSAQQFSGGDAGVIAKLVDLVRGARRAGLLMLGGSETLGSGRWQQHPQLMTLLPVDFSKAGFADPETRVELTKDGAALPFLQLSPDAKTNDKLWKALPKLDGIASLGAATSGAAILMQTTQGQPVLAAKDTGGRVAVFAADSTAKKWLTPETIGAFETFWKKLTLWISQQPEGADELWIKLDRRRVNVAAGETLGFTCGLRDKKGNDLPNAKLTVTVEGPAQSIAVTPIAEGKHQRGMIAAKLEPGEYQLVVQGQGVDFDGNKIAARQAARFLMVADEIEMLRPVAEQDTLRKLAAASGGRFFAAEEAALAAYLDELNAQVSTEAQHKTTQWPDWKRLPASEHARDQLAALWHSWALAGFVLFAALLACEWLLRRLWGLV